MQEHHVSLLLRETEKLRVDIEKMRSELRSPLKFHQAAYNVGFFFIIHIKLLTIFLFKT
jgi:hypothetical protein